MINNNISNLGLGNSPYKTQVPDFELDVKKNEEKTGDVRKAENVEREGAVVDKNAGRDVQLSKQGDELAVSKVGRASVEADGKVIEKTKDGVVAERDNKKIIKEEDLAERPKDVSGQTESRVAQMIDQEADKAAEKKAEAKKAEKAEAAKDAKEAKENKAAQAEFDPKENRAVMQSLVGKSKKEVDQMYRDGEISANQYQADKDRRDSIKPASEDDKGKLVQAMEEKDRFVNENKAILNAAENGRVEEMADILAKDGLFNGGDINKMLNID